MATAILALILRRCRRRQSFHRKKMSELKRSQLPDTLSAIPTKSDGEAIAEFGGKEPESLDFDALVETADKISVGLRRRGSGDKPGQPVILFAPASTQAIIAVVGILRSGRIVAPLDTQMPDDDLVHVLKNAEAHLVLTTRRLWHRLKALKGGPELECFLLDTEENEANGNGESAESGEPPSWHSLREDATDRPPDPKPGDRAVLFYTSGTTGPPKGVPLSHENILFQMRTVIRTGLLKADDRFLQPLPLHHVYPFVIGTLAPLALGLPVILPGALTGKALAVALRDGQASVTIGVPRLYQAFYAGIRDQIASLPMGGALFHSSLALAGACQRIGLPLGQLLFRPLRKKAAPRLRLLASGGSPLDPDLARRLESLGWPVAVGYGLTETAPLLTLKKSGMDSFDSVGRAVEGVRLRIDPEALEKDGEDAANRDRDSRRGELLAKGPNVFTGYNGNEAATRESFTESGWFRTGDIASIDPHGVVRLHGRVSTRIVLPGGENIDPSALEERYEAVDGVAEIGILEHEGKLAALVVPEDRMMRENDPETTSDRIREALKKRGRDLASYQQLSRIEISTRGLSRTRLGKLRRHELKEAFEKAREGGSGEPAGDRRESPLPEEEFPSQDRALLEDHRARAVWDLLCERYPDRPVAPDADPAGDLGIDSLEWVELSLAIESTTGASVDETMMARIGRVGDLLEAVAEAGEGADREARVSQALGKPDSMLDDDNRKWAEKRGPTRLALFSLFYPIIRGYLRLSQRVEAEGLENLPKDRPYILVPNHASHLDAPCLGVALGYRRARRLFWAGFTGVMFRNAFVRVISRLAQVVPINARSGPISSLAMAAHVLQRNHPLVWFPEGRISHDGTLQDFQPGIGLLLKHHDVPVVPVYVEGTHTALPRGKRLPRWGKVRVHFGPVIEPSSLRKDGEDREPKEIAGALRAAVQELADKSGKGEDPA